MFIDNLKQIYQKNIGMNPVYVRNAMKEYIQYYVLQFISQSVWSKHFIFKGGTCLRIFFELPRLSEDLDFDILNLSDFDLNIFLNALKKYFVSTVKFNKFEIKTAGNKRTIYLRFPILKDIEIPLSPQDSNVIFVRLDIAPVLGTKYSTELSIKSIYDFSFIVNRYSLPDLFAGKIAAILTRETIEGNIKKERVKGRDYYDLIWFLEKNIKPNWPYLEEITRYKKRGAIIRLNEKVKKADPILIQNDLSPFFQDNVFVNTFSHNIANLYKNYMKNMSE